VTVEELIEAPFRKATDGDVYHTLAPDIPMRVLSNRVIVKPAEEEYKGLIIIPTTAKKDAPTRGVVVAVGPGMLTKYGERWTMPDIKPGDTVLFHKHTNQPFELNGEKLYNLRDDSIIAVLEE
jgi:co-chaperonin GroES (HSP10)